MCSSAAAFLRWCGELIFKSGRNCVFPRCFFFTFLPKKKKNLRIVTKRSIKGECCHYHFSFCNDPQNPATLCGWPLVHCWKSQTSKCPPNTTRHPNQFAAACTQRPPRPSRQNLRGSWQTSVASSKTPKKKVVDCNKQHRHFVQSLAPSFFLSIGACNPPLNGHV